MRLKPERIIPKEVNVLTAEGQEGVIKGYCHHDCRPIKDYIDCLPTSLRQLQFVTKALRLVSRSSIIARMTPGSKQRVFKQSSRAGQNTKNSLEHQHWWKSVLLQKKMVTKKYMYLNRSAFEADLFFVFHVLKQVLSATRMT